MIPDILQVREMGSIGRTQKQKRKNKKEALARGEEGGKASAS